MSGAELNGADSTVPSRTTSPNDPPFGNAAVRPHGDVRAARHAHHVERVRRVATPGAHVETPLFSRRFRFRPGFQRLRHRPPLDFGKHRARAPAGRSGRRRRRRSGWRERTRGGRQRGRRTSRRVWRWTHARPRGGTRDACSRACAGPRSIVADPRLRRESERRRSALRLRVRVRPGLGRGGRTLRFGERSARAASTTASGPRRSLHLEATRSDAPSSHWIARRARAGGAGGCGNQHSGASGSRSRSRSRWHTPYREKVQHARRSARGTCANSHATPRTHGFPRMWSLQSGVPSAAVGALASARGMMHRAEARRRGVDRAGGVDVVTGETRARFRHRDELKTGTRGGARRARARGWDSDGLRRHRRPVARR